MTGEPLTEELVSSLTVYEGAICNLRRDRVKLPNGRIVDREVVVHPGAVAIIPIVDGKIVLVRQFRQAPGKILCEIPAGTLRIGEVPDLCAARELQEETGYRAKCLKKLFHCYLAPGYSTELLHFYAAFDLEQVGRNTDSDEFIQVLTVTKAQAFEMILSNEIEDAKTICGILVIERNLFRDSK